MREKHIVTKSNNLFPYFSNTASLLFLFLVVFGCTSPGVIPDTDHLHDKSHEIESSSDSDYLQDEPSITAKTDVDESILKEIITTEEANIPSNVIDEQMTDQENDTNTLPDEYVPTEDLFLSTFARVEEIIRELNGIIQARDFNRWVQYLTQEHRAQLSSPSYLQEVSRRPILANRSIVLTSLQDYFLQVVVPSRANLRLDDLVFINEQKVQAFMMFGDTKVSLYQLVYVDGDWKIGEF
jgi:hypothetical protein